MKKKKKVGIGEEGGGGGQSSCTSLFVQSYRGVFKAKHGFSSPKRPGNHPKLRLGKNGATGGQKWVKNGSKVGQKWGLSECHSMTSSPSFPPNLRCPGEFKPALVLPQHSYFCNKKMISIIAPLFPLPLLSLSLSLL